MALSKLQPVPYHPAPYCSSIKENELLDKIKILKKQHQRKLDVLLLSLQLHPNVKKVMKPFMEIFVDPPAYQPHLMEQMKSFLHFQKVNDFVQVMDLILMNADTVNLPDLNTENALVDQFYGFFLIELAQMLMYSELWIIAKEYKHTQITELLRRGN